jgi:MoaA/NifB/PqqE/SkfB family radical SAM enzyme
MNNNKTFCMAPWTHMNIGPNGDVYPCCMMPVTDTEGIDEDIRKQNDEINIELVDDDLQETIKAIEKTIGDELLDPLKVVSTEVHGTPRDFKMGSLMKESLKDIWNNEKMRELRRNMIAGKECSYCTSCYKEEEIGHGSLRLHMNSAYAKHYEYVKETKEDGTFDRFNVVYWDFRLNNVCNFKCRMCSPGYSSTWEQEMRKEFNIEGEYPKIDVDMVHQDIEPLYDIVEEVYFAGGEPLISDHHYIILKNLIKKKRNKVVRLSYNTNFSTLKYKNNDILSLWKKFPNLSLSVSFDGTEKRGELIRKGFDWQKFLDNFRLFRSQFPHVNVKINYVFQVTNCFHTMDAHKELYMRGIIKSWDDFSLCILHNPDYMSVLILDPESRKLLGQKIKHHIENYLAPAKANESIKQYISVLKLLSTDRREHLIPYFKSYMSGLDYIRNENCLEVFPELERILGND